MDIKEFARRWNYGFSEDFKRARMEDAGVEGHWATDTWVEFTEEEQEQERLFASYQEFDSWD